MQDLRHKKREVSRVGVLSSNIRYGLTLPNLSLAFALLCCLLIGKFEQYTSLFSLSLLGVMLLNWNKDEFYLFSCVLLLFWEQFYLIPGSTSLYRAYSYLVMIRFFLDIGKAKFRPQFLPPLAVMVCFCVLSASQLYFRMAMTLLADSLLCYMVLIRVRENPKMFRKLTVMFTLAAVCAGIYSLLAKTMFSYGTGLGANEVKIVRYYGTVGDANYAGCFFNVAFFMALCSDAFKKWYVRLPIVGLLLYFILLTASQTALLCLGACFGLYLLLRYRFFGIPLLIVYVLGILAGFFILINIPNPQSLGPFATLATRLQTSFSSAISGNISSLTTGRTDLWKIAWDFYVQQPIEKILLGGNVITTLLTEEYWLNAVGAVHQSYIQGLMNFGLIGTVIIFGVRIVQTLGDTIAVFTKDETHLPVDLNRCVVISSVIFLLYSLTIDIFMDWRFLYLYFI